MWHSGYLFQEYKNTLDNFERPSEAASISRWKSGVFIIWQARRRVAPQGPVFQPLTLYTCCLQTPTLPAPHALFLLCNSLLSVKDALALCLTHRGSFWSKTRHRSLRWQLLCVNTVLLPSEHFLCSTRCVFVYVCRGEGGVGSGRGWAGPLRFLFLL